VARLQSQEPELDTKLEDIVRKMLDLHIQRMDAKVTD
jgi:hypothetical protein